VQTAVALAVSSGALGVEAVALVGEGDPSPADLEVLADLPGREVILWVADRTGVVRDAVHVGG
jgi:hypothetical protein